jgi:hypothetical protein
MFSDKPEEAVGQFVQFTGEPHRDSCLEIPESKVTVRDDDLRQMIRHQFGIEAITICNEIRERQDTILRVLKEVDGSNIRQIARITGLSSARIWKV